MHQAILEKRLVQLISEKQSQNTEHINKTEDHIIDSQLYYPSTDEKYQVVRSDGFREEVFMNEASKLMEIDEEEFNTDEIKLSSTVLYILAHTITRLELSMARQIQTKEAKVL